MGKSTRQKVWKMQAALIPFEPAHNQDEEYVVPKKGIKPGQIFTKKLGDFISTALLKQRKNGESETREIDGVKATVGRDANGTGYVILSKAKNAQAKDICLVFENGALLGISDSLEKGKAVYGDIRRRKVAELIAIYKTAFGEGIGTLLGFSEDEIGKGKQEAAKNEEILRRFARGNNFDLGSLEEFDGKAGNADFRVGVGCAAFLTPGSKHKSLFATGARNCELAVVVLRSGFSDAPARVSLLHADGFWQSEDYADFFKRATEGAVSPGNIEIYIVSGRHYNVLDLYDQATKTGGKVYLSVEETERVDAVRVDGDGKIYYSSKLPASDKDLKEELERIDNPPSNRRERAVFKVVN
jgi:hypothetical protein